MGMIKAILHVDGDIHQPIEAVVAAPQVSQQGGIKSIQQTGSPTWVSVDVFRGVLRQADESLHVLEY